MATELSAKGGIEKKIYTEELYEKCPNDKKELLIDFPKYCPTFAMQEFIIRYELVKLINHIPGDIFEMGVCGGRGLFSFYHSCNILEHHMTNRRIYGFDTFSGLCGIGEKDGDKYSDNDFSFINIEELNNFISIHNKNNNTIANKINLVKGDIINTLDNYLNSNQHQLVSLLYLDLDIYKPTKYALNKILPRMCKGSVIAFDEINHKSFPGETLALLETFNLNNIKIHNILNSHVNYIIL